MGGRGQWQASARVCLSLVMCGACTPDAVGVGETGGSSTGAASSDERTETTTSVVRPPQPEILDAPAAVARGGRMYVLLDTPPGRLRLDIDGVPMGDPLAIVQGDLAGALYRVPLEIPRGQATVYARHVDDPNVVAAHPLQIQDRRFVDVAAQVGLAIPHDTTGSPTECAQSHTGVAAGDVDLDGWPDLFVGNVGSGGRLMHSQGTAQRTQDGVPVFSDITAAAGLSGVDQVTSVAFVDLEGDGDPDLFIGRRGQNRVFENRRVPDGEIQFVDITNTLGLGVHSQRTMGVAFGDYDGDDDLDLYVVNHAFCFPTPGSDIRAGDHLYENVDGVLVERTEQITGPATASVGFSASWIDIDSDGDADLVVINDDVSGNIGRPNALWRNDGPTPGGGWAFVDISSSSGVAVSGVNGMGLALGDLNHDGAVDMAFTNIGRNYLLLGDGNGTFEDVSEAAGVDRGRLPWGRESITWAAHLLDHDNDGDLDLYFSGGRIKGASLIPDVLLDNDTDNDGALQFSDVTWTSGMANPGHGKASMLVDLDRDGAWDIVTTAWGEPLSVYHNRAAPPQNHWLAVELVGRGGNADAVGALVELDAGKVTRTCFHTNRPAQGAGGESTCHFGLGATAQVDALRITWPDGLVQALPGPSVDQRVRLLHPDP